MSPNVERVVKQYPIGHQIWDDVLQFFNLAELKEVHEHVQEKLQAAHRRNCSGLQEIFLLTKIEQQISKGGKL